MIAGQVGLWSVVVLLLVFRRRRKMRVAKLDFFTRHPLAGVDSGVRSPFRAPRGVRFHKGF